MSMPERGLEENESKMCADQRSAVASKANCEMNTKDKDRQHSYEESIEAVVKANYSEEQVDDYSESDTSTILSDDVKQIVAVPNPDEADLPSDESNRDDCTTPDDKTTTKQYEYFNKTQTKVPSIQKSGQAKQLKLKSILEENGTEAASKLPKKGKSQKNKINLKYHLLELQRHRLEIGTWVQCTNCKKWRYLATITDPQEVDSNWKCSMNPNSNFSSCEAKEILPPALEEQDMIYSSFSVGSLVWVLQPGYPWWPAMVDDDPDVEQFYWLNDYSDIPTHYNVVFFDSEPVSRAWIPAQSVIPFSDKEKNKTLTEPKINNARLRIRLAKAKKDAMRASILSLESRLQEFSFVARYKGKLHIFKDGKKSKNKNKHSPIVSQKLVRATKHLEKPCPKKAAKLQSESDSKSSEHSSDGFSSDTSEKSAVSSALATQSSAASSTSSSCPSSPEQPKKKVKTGEKRFKTEPPFKKIHHSSANSRASGPGPSSLKPQKVKSTKKMVSTVKTMEKKGKTAPQFKKLQQNKKVITHQNPNMKESRQSDVDVNEPNDDGACTNGYPPNEHHATNKGTSKYQSDTNEEHQNDEHATNDEKTSDQHTSNDEATNDETPNDQSATKDKTLNEQPGLGEQPKQKIKTSATEVAKKIPTSMKINNRIALENSNIAKQVKKEKSGKSKKFNESSNGTSPFSKTPKASKKSTQAGKSVLSINNNTSVAVKKGVKPCPIWKKENFEKKISSKKFSAPVIKNDTAKSSKIVEIEKTKKALPLTFNKENTLDVETKEASEKKRKSAVQFKAPIIKQARADNSCTAVQPKLETECETIPDTACPEASNIHNNPVGVDTDTQPSSAAALDSEMLSLAPLQDADLDFQPNSPLFDMEED